MGKYDTIAFDTHGFCPICNKLFRGDLCPHSYRQAVEYLTRRKDEEHIRKIVREEIAEFLKDAFVYSEDGELKIGRMS